MPRMRPRAGVEPHARVAERARARPRAPSSSAPREPRAARVGHDVHALDLGRRRRPSAPEARRPPPARSSSQPTSERSRRAASQSADDRRGGRPCESSARRAGRMLGARSRRAALARGLRRRSPRTVLSITLAILPRPWRATGTTSSSPTAPRARGRRPSREREEQRRGFFRRLRENMRKTREALAAEVQATLFEGDLDEETWERLEEALIYADVGARTTAAGRRAARARGRGGRARRRRGADRPARRAARRARPHRRRHDRPAPRARP